MHARSSPASRLGGKYVIKGKGYSTLVVQVTDPSITFVTGESGRETTEFVTALNTWEKVCESGSQKIMHNGGNDAKLKTRLSKSSPLEVKMLV